MGWLNSSIHFNNESFELRKGLHRNSMKWDDVAGIYGEKLDKITYEEIFLIVSNRSGEKIAIGEMDDGFKMWEIKLRQIFGDIASDWRNKLEASEPGIREEIWCRR